MRLGRVQIVELMPTACLAFLRLAPTVDGRLAEPLHLLAEVGARDTTDGHLSAFFADLPESLGLTLPVAELPRKAPEIFGRWERHWPRRGGSFGGSGIRGVSIS